MKNVKTTKNKLLLKAMGGMSQVAFREAINEQLADGVKLVSQQRISDWLNNTLRIPSEYAIPIERAAIGRVTRYELRPDVFGESPEE